MSQEKIDKLWYSMLANPKVTKDKLGLTGDGAPDDRVEVNKGDFRFQEEDLEFSKAMQAEVMKQKNPSEKVIDAMHADVCTNHLGFDDDFFHQLGGNGKSLQQEGFDAQQLLAPTKRCQS